MYKSKFRQCIADVGYRIYEWFNGFYNIVEAICVILGIVAFSSMIIFLIILFFLKLG
jgi:hypothetical protein